MKYDKENKESEEESTFLKIKKKIPSQQSNRLKLKKKVNRNG